MYTPVNPSFTIQKWGLRGSVLYRRVFVMTSGGSTAHWNIASFAWLYIYIVWTVFCGWLVFSHRWCLGSKIFALSAMSDREYVYYDILCWDLITPHAPMSTQPSNLVVFRLQPEYFYLLLYKNICC